MIGESACFQLLESALAAADADQAEAFSYATDSSLTRFAESVIHQNVAERNAIVSVRAVLGKRIGCARGNQADPDQVTAVARRAHELAAVAAEDEAFVSLPAPQPIAVVSGFASATAASTPEQRAELARTIVEVASAEGCRASGSVSAEMAELAVANSLGVRAYAPVTQASAVLVVSDGDASGYADWRGMDISQLDGRALAEVATRKCVASRGAEPVEPGEYTVILEPAAVGELIMFLSSLAHL